MNGNDKNTEDDSGCDIFVIVGTAFYNNCKRNEAIVYILGAEVSWGKFLIEVMGGSSIKTSRIYDGTLWE